MPPDEIDRQIAGDENRQFSLCLEGMTLRCAQSRHQLVDAKWLADVVVGAKVERLDL